MRPISENCVVSLTSAGVDWPVRSTSMRNTLGLCVSPSTADTKGGKGLPVTFESVAGSAMYFFPVPLWLLAGFKLLGDFSGMFESGSGIGHAAHLGGALAGTFFWWFDLRLYPSPGQQEYLERPSPGLRASLARLWSRRRAVAVAAPEAPRVDGDTALQVDELLRKISKDGMGSLSADELAFLKGASERYKRD